MQTLEERLQAISEGRQEDAGGQYMLPAFDDKEMEQCISAIHQLVSMSKQTSLSPSERLLPPGGAVHVIL